jgi:hypothetical protein
MRTIRRTNAPATILFLTLLAPRIGGADIWLVRFDVMGNHNPQGWREIYDGSLQWNLWPSSGKQGGSEILNSTGVDIVAIHIKVDKDDHPDDRFLVDAGSGGALFTEIWKKADDHGIIEVIFIGGPVLKGRSFWSLVPERHTGEMPPVESAWAVVGVAAFAQPIVGIVSLYDLAYDIAVQHFGLIPPPEVSFTRDIFPVLERPVLMQWVDADARRGHGPGAPGDFLGVLFDLLRNNDPTLGSDARKARERVFARLKTPAGGGPGDMPRLNGLSLTKRQYELFRRWSIGDFLADWHGVPVCTPFDQLPPSEQPNALDQASLWKGVGGAFSPGIEVGSHFADYQTFQSPFRIKTTLPAGHLTSTLSVPWQEDYSACGWGWWPSGRPNYVTADGTTFNQWARFAAGESMPTSWWKLGFLAKRTLVGGRIAYLETERV